MMWECNAPRHTLYHSIYGTYACAVCNTVHMRIMHMHMHPMHGNAIWHQGIWTSSINNTHDTCSFGMKVRGASAMRVCIRM